MNKSEQLARETIGINLKFPLEYDSDGQCIVDRLGRRVADIRGWAWIQKLDNPEERQDAIGELIALLLNETIVTSPEILDERRLQNNINSGKATEE